MKKQPLVEKKTNIDISIIIPNLHSPIIDRTLESLLNQKKNFLYEIVTVGQDKYHLVDRYIEQGVIYIQTEKPTPPGIARNIGVERSTGKYLFFIDADCIAPLDWINQHMNIHQNSLQPIVVGGGVTFPEKPYLSLVDNVATFHEYMEHLPPDNREQLPTINLSLPRSIWNQVGGFYPYPTGEDSEFTTRILVKKIPLLFNPGVKINHQHSRKKFSHLLSHAFHFGKYSIKGNEKYWDLLKIPSIFKCKLFIMLLSPVLAGSVIAKILFSERLPVRYWKTLPIVFLLKIVWCFGFAFHPHFD